ncbi:MAG: TonB-dependent receptor, partial [Cytophagaceae bacterium]
MKQILTVALFVGAFLIPLFLSAQNAPVINSTVTGRVIDARTSENLIGATVVIKGTTNGGPTDQNGEFKLLTGQKLPFVVLVSFVGYVTKEIVISDNNVDIKLEESSNQLSDVVITSRRRQESAQDVPIPISVVSGNRAEDAGAFNVNRLKELVPTVQLYASNARNTTLNIRGLGSTFGLTNDGIDPGVGFYVDGVYYARPAATALDFIDIEQVEVLRGPQGTLFGKNTTAGAFNITTRPAGFTPSGSFELSYGNYGYIQAKGSLTGPISKKLAARVSFTGTQRNGTFYNVHTQLPINDINNIGVRAQLLYTPSDNVRITIIGDVSEQKPNGYGWPVAGVVPTKRAAYRQFNAIIADLNYKLPYSSAFDRIVDLDTPSKADNNLGGVSVNADIKIGNGTLTSTTAWRHWQWTPLNDRDYIG